MPPSALPVLVVDDNRDVLTMLGIAMQRVGYAPTLVTTATAALQALTITRFAAVLLDYSVSTQAGHAIITQVQQVAPPPVLILMTGHSWESLADQLAHVPLTAFLAKPFSIPTLYATLARSLHGVGGDDAPIAPD
jgi:two-component system response regulator GlrR